LSGQDDSVPPHPTSNFFLLGFLQIPVTQPDWGWGRTFHPMPPWLRYCWVRLPAWGFLEVFCDKNSPKMSYCMYMGQTDRQIDRQTDGWTDGIADRVLIDKTTDLNDCDYHSYVVLIFVLTIASE